MRGDGSLCLEGGSLTVGGVGVAGSVGGSARGAGASGTSTHTSSVREGWSTA